jgi:hypothetical protein
MLSFFDYFSVKNNKSWIPVAKVGVAFLIVGILIELLQEIIIGLLAMVFFAIGLFLFVIAYKIWNNTRNN